MIYFYQILVMILSIFLGSRLVIYSQMNGYRLRIKEASLIEITIIFVVSAIMEINILICTKFVLDISITYIILVTSLVIFTSISMARGYKVKPNMTARLKRLLCTYTMFNVLSVIVYCIVLHYVDNIVYAIYVSSTYPINEPILLYMSLSIINPIEEKHNEKYILANSEKLATYNSIKVIGITGSFGKTSVKNILCEMLKIQYKVKCTPQSYNTPIGVAKSINDLDGDEDYFIVEMGARHMGDIDELCKLTHPRYGIITGITAQHIATFGSISNVKRTKYELYNNIPNNGLCVFNGNNDETTALYKQSNNSNSMLVCDDNVHIEKEKISLDGMDFELYIKGNSIMCHTILVGKHHLDNILMASSLAYELGVSIENISKAIGNLSQIPHRFEISNNGGIYIIDDSYNANIDGVRRGLETISQFEGRKIVATQGIVEGGEEDTVLNTEVGMLIAQYANVAILIGRKRNKIEKGLIDAGYNMNNVFKVRSLKSAERIFSALLRPRDILYITNDLPDNY